MQIDKYKQAFQEEARERLVELEAALLALSQTPGDLELVSSAFRALHTIKGSGAMFGFDDVAAFTHHIESAFDAVRNGRLAATSDLINLALSALDHIKAMLDSEGGQGRVLAKARLGVFTTEVIRPVAADLRRRYFMRSRNPNSNQVRVVPELRNRIEFEYLNLMEDFGFPQAMDGIFCRNVIIYFDRPTQERLLLKLSRQLVPGGYMFVGHSETLHQMNLPLTPVAPALYRKTNPDG